MNTPKSHRPEQWQLDGMAIERMHGATIRAIAKRFNRPRSSVHRWLQGIEILPPPPRYRAEIIQQEDGRYAVRHYAED